MTSQSRTFVFNGDNKQTQVKDASNNVIGNYFYDGEGKRVKKVTNTETTVFVYSGGKLIAEYSTNVAPIEDAKVAYLTTDHLGTPRVITNQFGNVVSRRDFLPFGEEIHTGVGARSTTLDYGSTEDNVRQKFTGYQKDIETSLDFAEARMYENRFGRFTAVDPLLASGKSINPQTFNRFVYVGNSPLVLVDPDGLQVATAAGKVYINRAGTQVAIFDGKPRRGFVRLDRSIETTTRIGKATHQMSVTPNGWTVGDRVDGARFTAPAASPLQGPPVENAAIRALATTIAEDSRNAAIGLRNGAVNTGIETFNLLNPIGRLAGLEVPTIQAENARQAGYEWAFKIGFGTGSGIAGGAITSSSASISFVTQSGARGIYGYRYMTQGEINAVQNTGLLRGGNAGETFFTKDVFKSTTSATERLALPTPATHRMEFQILNNPNLSRTGERVLSDFGRTGGGNQFSTFDPVRVRIINIQPLRP